MKQDPDSSRRKGCPPRKARASSRAATSCRLAIRVAAGCIAILAATAATAAAETPPLLWQSPADGQAGQAAGQMLSPGAIAVEAATPGHIFLADGNHRIDELNAWGQFERAWGWEVVASGPNDDAPQNERQELSVSATAGTYKLRYFNAYGAGNPSQHTTAIPFNATASEVQAALLALPSLEPGDIAVSGSGPLTIEFKGALADTAIPELKLDGAGLALQAGAELECGRGREPVNATFQWLRNGAPIPGATDSTYTTVPADEGKAIQCQLFATTINTGSTQVSNPAQLVAPLPSPLPPTAPSSIPSPTPSEPTLGTMLTCKPGSWGGSPAFAYQWYRNGAPIPAATASTYVLTAPDVASPAVLQCAVTATNAGGATTEVSENRATGSPPGPPKPGAPGIAESPESILGVRGVTTIGDGGSFEVCVPGEGDLCRAGQRGGYGAGQFARGTGASGVAVDAGGDVYALDTVFGGAGEDQSQRVQKFDNDGHFLLMWGGEVDKTTGADRCTAADLAAGDVCGSGIPGTGPGRFEQAAADGIEVGPEGNVFVGDKQRIQKFDPEGNYLGEVALPGKTVTLGAIDTAGNFYVTYGLATFGGDREVHKLSPAGVELGQFKAEAQVGAQGSVGSPATGSDGRVYLVEGPPFGGAQPRILGFKADGSCFICPADNLRATPTTQPFALATSSACGIPGEDLYASFSGGAEAFLRGYGPPPDPALCPPPQVPPTVVDQYALSVDPDGAVVEAKINPNFWADTRYYVQYGTGKCSAGGCEEIQPLAPGSLLTSEVSNSVHKSGGVFLTGLTPHTTYHYRFIAKSSGGGPVYGADPDGEGPLGPTSADGGEGAFTTFPLPTSPDIECPNQAFRTGPSAALPDCRAYELVSPLDKANGDIVSFTEEGGTYAALNQSSTDGDKLAYSSFRAFGDAPSAPLTSAYIASRGAAGWSSHGISPPIGPSLIGTVPALINQFQVLSPDLCSGWLFDQSDLSLAPGAVPNFANLYRRQNCGPEADSYTALTTAAPPNIIPEHYKPELKGVSADGAQAVFTARDKLTANAPTPGDESQLLYEAFGNGKLRFVCLLPTGLPVSGAKGCAAGTATSNSSVADWGSNDSVHNAISADGSRIFWSDQGFNQGRLYVRIDGKTTLRITTEPAQFWTASDDGSRAIYSVGSALYEFDLASEESHLIAGTSGLLGASDDAQRLYFVSGAALAPGASVGRPNLYLLEGGTGGQYTFVATLPNSDINGAQSPISAVPSTHTARVTPDGLHAIFLSQGSLTGYDNKDPATGEADPEVFVYDGSTDQLHCISCNPTGARPLGRELKYASRKFWGVAQFPSEQSEIEPGPRILSDDGTRAYFESIEALVPADTNGAQDVYQWEALGKGACTESSPAFSQPNGGCLSLVSSGQSPVPAEIVDVSPSGDDVFFDTATSLLPQDPGLVDVYDARVHGGFPQPTQAAQCEGEACQGPYSPPDDPTPASSTYQGPGNPAAVARKKVHKKKRRHKKQRHHRSNHDRRAAR